MEKIAGYLPSSEGFYRRRGAYAGFVVGVAVPLVIAGLFLVSYRGYGITESAPVPEQVYTSF